MDRFQGMRAMGTEGKHRGPGNEKIRVEMGMTKKKRALAYGEW